MSFRHLMRSVQFEECGNDLRRSVCSRIYTHTSCTHVGIVQIRAGNLAKVHSSYLLVLTSNLITALAHEFTHFPNCCASTISQRRRINAFHSTALCFRGRALSIYQVIYRTFENVVYKQKLDMCGHFRWQRRPILRNNIARLCSESFSALAK